MTNENKMHDMMIVNHFNQEGDMIYEEIIHAEEFEEYKNSFPNSSACRFTDIKIPTYVPADNAGLVIFLEEEYGYRNWIWETGMDWDTLKKWFKNIDDEHCLDPETLPGRVIPASIAHRGMTVYPNINPNIDQGMNGFDQVHYIQYDPIFGRGHVHMVDDSHISFGTETVYPEITDSDKYETVPTGMDLIAELHLKKWV